MSSQTDTFVHLRTMPVGCAKIVRVDGISAPSRRARLVLVTGEPGSGKSTLGTELARALRVPFIARDDVRGGLFFTEGAWTADPRRVPSSDDAVEVLLRLVETAAEMGISCIVEYVVRRDRPADWERLTAVADCVVLQTTCRDPRSRFVERNRSDRLLNRPPVLDALGHASIGDHTTDAIRRMQSVAGEMRADFDAPTMQVDTDDGYQPGLDRIIEFVTAEHRRR